MTLLVRDEVDIIKANIDYHLALGVDHIVAIDNGSVDGTRDILAEYQRAGILTLFDEPVQDFSQADWVTRAALYARDHCGADWILNNDADEFWAPRSGALKDILAVSAATLLACPRFNMMAAHPLSDQVPWITRLRYRAAEPVAFSRLDDFLNDPLPAPYLYLKLPPKALLRAHGLLQVKQGNHTAVYEGKKRPEHAPIDIFHYPIRSPAQFERKIIQGGQAYGRNTELPEVVGWHWRRWYHLYQTAGLAAVLADVMPSEDRLVTDLTDGKVVEDARFEQRFQHMMPAPEPAFSST